MTIRRFLRTYLGLLILIGAMAFAVVRVVINQLTYESPGVDTIRICHWQLEAGFREALDRLIREYERFYFRQHGRKVRVLQVPISERGYRQFVNTGLIAGNAPDIIEKGKAVTARDPTYVARFFLPLGDCLGKPNPYNRGTDLEGIAWKDTFFDGLQGTYDPELLDYYYIPFSMFTIRIYYNKQLYRQTTGSENPPEDYEGFLRACKTIKEAGYVPIAASKAQGQYFRIRYENPFRFGFMRQVDSNFNGYADPFETYHAYRSGQWSFDSPRLVSSWRCLVDIAENFPKGWLAAQRDDALFMFAQQRAVMIASGSWDAQSMIDQTKDNFELGIFDFPMPVDHPQYGKFVRGPASEAAIRGGIPWAVTQHSEHPEICIDFLQFCTTRANNEQFNGSITWLPVVRGAELSSEILRGFKPRIKGFSGVFDYDISSTVRLIGTGNRWPLYAGMMSPEEYGEELKQVYERTALDGYAELLDKQRRNIRNRERLVAAESAMLYFAPPGDRETHQQKLLQVLQTVGFATHDFMYNRNRSEEF